MAGDLRICVISSGLDRFHKPCSDIFKKQIGLDSHPIDFYGLFWKPVNDAKMADHLEGFRSATIWTAPQRTFDDIPNVPKPPETNVKNVLSMLWGKWLLGHHMTLEHVWDKYDLFLYCRPDVCFDNRLNWKLIWESMDNFDLLLTTNGHWRDGVNDQVAIGNRKLEVYLNLFAEFTNYIGEGVILHPETLLKHHLLRQGIRIAQYPAQNVIFRDETRFHIG